MRHAFAMRQAFTMIEMMVVIFLIGVIATIVLPRLAYKTPQSEWRTVLYDLNNLALFARQEAISNHANYRLNFKSGGNSPDTMIIEREERDPENPNKIVYTKAESHYLKTNYQFHPTIKIKDFYHGKKNAMTDNTVDMCCYIVPDGLVQDILIHFTRNEKGVESKASFKMMPFYGRFEFHDDFIKPEA
jgi:prepilin-type N-terminal cleavage/methylation domain-containing protein